MLLALPRPERTRWCAGPLEQVVAETPDDIAAWAHLGVAWRLSGDERHAWLAEQPGLVRALDLEIPDDELNALSDRELADIGMSRLNVRDVAREAVYG